MGVEGDTEISVSSSWPNPGVPARRSLGVVVSCPNVFRGIEVDAEAVGVRSLASCALRR